MSLPTSLTTLSPPAAPAASKALPRWVRRAQAAPLAFAQVREDPRIDLAALTTLGPGLRVLMVASGGCSAAYLAARGAIADLHLVDINPAQLALCRLKLSWLMTQGPRARRALLGHAPMEPGLRQARVQEACADLGIPPDCFGDPGDLGVPGLDYAGRYEQVFAELQRLLAPWRGHLEHLLAQRDPRRQIALLDAQGLGQAITQALSRVMSLANLQALFGAGATANRRQPFARHFAQRIRWALGRFPAARNPWLAQLLLGPRARQAAPWLSVTPPARLPRLTYHLGGLETALAARTGPFDAILCSNIVDWLAPADAAGLLSQCRSRLRPGGLVIIRQLNSTVDIRHLAAGLTWLPQADRWQARERSFFYPGLHVGRRA